MYFFKFSRSSHRLKTIRKIAFYPFGLIYGTILQIRNWCFDKGILKSIKPPFPSISVGNLTVGGTGKTPAIKFLLEKLGAKESVVISRGYGRKSTGYHVIESNTESETSGDEPLEIKQAFPSSKVVVCEKRRSAVDNLASEKDISLLLFDDLYQHRYVRTHCNILLSSFKNPFYNDFVLPAGSLREFAFNKKRADLLLLTKCPNDLSPEIAQKIRSRSKVSVPTFFSGLKYEVTRWVINHPKNNKVILLASVAQADDFFDEGEQQHKVVHKIKLPDHYNYSEKKVKEIISLANKNKADLVTTAKDIVKLRKFEPLFEELSVGVLEVKMQVLFNETDDFLNTIKEKIKND